LSTGSQGGFLGLSSPQGVIVMTQSGTRRCLIRLRVRAAAGLIALLFTAVVRSETVDVKYRGNVNLKTFQRRHTLRSSFAQRVSFDLNYSWSKGVKT
jgi:hypothetical protein